MKTIYTFLLLGLVSINLVGCGHSGAKYDPIIDGAKNQAYYNDLGACQKVAEQRSYINDDVKSNALAGAVMGGLLGAADKDATLGGGAAVGAILAGATSSWGTHKERKEIVTECMKGRGHKVVG